jgi:hypothetical protein
MAACLIALEAQVNGEAARETFYPGGEGCGHHADHGSHAAGLSGSSTEQTDTDVGAEGSWLLRGSVTTAYASSCHWHQSADCRIRPRIGPSSPL